MMWPKIHYPLDGDLLAINNNIGKNAYFEEEVAEKLGAILLKDYPSVLQARYKLENLDIDAINLLEYIAKKKGFPLKNHLLDLEKASTTLLNDYRQGSLGRITLETPSSRELMIKNNNNSLDTDTKKTNDI